MDTKFTSKYDERISGDYSCNLSYWELYAIRDAMEVMEKLDGTCDYGWIAAKMEVAISIIEQRYKTQYSQFFK